MSLTKAQRHKVYVTVDRTWDRLYTRYLCLCIPIIADRLFGCYHTKHEFPELMRMEPKGADPYVGWFSSDSQRRSALRKLIAQTKPVRKPALGARKAATKERVPAKQNRATAILKGTGRSRAKAAPKKKRT